MDGEATGRTDGRAAILDAQVTLPASVVRRAFVGQSVMLNLTTGHYYALNETATIMLDALAGAELPRDAVPGLARIFGLPEQEVAGSLASLCLDLAALGLIERAPGAEA